jgi:hypothetical protein
MTENEEMLLERLEGTLKLLESDIRLEQDLIIAAQHRIAAYEVAIRTVGDTRDWAMDLLSKGGRVEV